MPAIYEPQWDSGRQLASICSAARRDQAVFTAIPASFTTSKGRHAFARRSFPLTEKLLPLIGAGAPAMPTPVTRAATLP
jgi:hypothetical protein